MDEVKRDIETALNIIGANIDDGETTLVNMRLDLNIVWQLLNATLSRVQELME